MRLVALALVATVNMRAGGLKTARKQGGSFAGCREPRALVERLHRS